MKDVAFEYKKITKKDVLLYKYICTLKFKWEYKKLSDGSGVEYSICSRCCEVCAEHMKISGTVHKKTKVQK